MTTGALPMLATLFAASLVQIPVKTTTLDEESPVASGPYLAWAQNTRAEPLHYDVYLQKGRGPRVKVNAPGTIGRPGGIAGRTLAYHEIRRGQSDIRFFDLVTHRRTSPAAGVNTSQWEWRPTVSGRWLLFGRVDRLRNIHRVILADLRTGRERTLGTVRGHAPYAEPGQVNGRFAVWTTCPDGACSVWRYDIAVQRTTRISGNPYSKPQYAASVNRDGVVYFARSGPTCGSQVQLLRASLHGLAEVLITFPVGQDLHLSYATSSRNGATSVFYDRVACKTRSFDIYQTVDSQK